MPVTETVVLNVIVCEPVRSGMMIVSPLAGTVPPLQLAPVVQLPPVVKAHVFVAGRVLLSRTSTAGRWGICFLARRPRRREDGNSCLTRWSSQRRSIIGGLSHGKPDYSQ